MATLGWNGARHMASWYGTTNIGAVLHTLNPRLFPEQIAWIAAHAGDRLLLCSDGLSDLVEALPQFAIEKRDGGAVFVKRVR